MVPDVVPLYAVVIVLCSLMCFSFSSITFLFVPLDVPEVARLFRGLFSIYFRVVAATGLLATVAFAASGRIDFMAGMLVLVATALATRGWTLHRIDAQQDAYRAGDRTAMRRLRMLHWGSMVANILVIASMAGSTRYIL